MNKRLQVVDIVVNKVLEDMKHKKRPIWKSLFNLNHFNRWTGKRYKGINIFLLLLQGGSGEYITMKQLNLYNKKNNTSYLVKQGTKSLMITFQKKSVRKAFDYEIEEYENGNNRFGVFEDDGEYKRSYFVLRYYNVFDLNDIADKDGNLMPRFDANILDEVIEGEKEIPPSLSSNNPEEMMQEYCNREVILFVHEKCTPHYNPTMDIIKVPEPDTFKAPVNYHSVCFHEAVHSTGSEKRLNRKCLEEYHRDMSIRGTEELIAEIGANMLLVESGYSVEEIDIDETTDYLTHWALWIENNKESFIYACNAAHKAVDYFLGQDSEQNNYEEVLEFEEIEINLDETLEAKPVPQGEMPIHIEEELNNHLTTISTNPLDEGESNPLTEQPISVEINSPVVEEALEIENRKEIEEHLNKGSKVIALSEGSHMLLDSVLQLNGLNALAISNGKKVKYHSILSVWTGNAEAYNTFPLLKQDFNYLIKFQCSLTDGKDWSESIYGSVADIRQYVNKFLSETGNHNQPLYIKEMYAYK